MSEQLYLADITAALDGNYDLFNICAPSKNIFTLMSNRGTAVRCCNFPLQHHGLFVSLTSFYSLVCMFYNQTDLRDLEVVFVFY